MHVRQLRGMVHAKLIKRRAMRMWRKSNLQEGLWHECLKTEMEKHRLKVENEIIRKTVEDRLGICFDSNGWVG